MKLLDRLERRFGRYALPNVTLWLVAAQAFVYLADRGPAGAPGALVERFSLVPALVMQGEVWRLVTFPLAPPALNPFLLLIYLAAFYYFGSAVEAAWGAFKYNAYLAIGFLLTAAAAFVEPAWPTTGTHVKTSVFLAFAALYPDAIIRLYFLIPVKAKFLAGFTWALYAYAMWFGDLTTRATILAAVGNFFLFFGSSAFATFKQAKRRRDFKKRVEAISKIVHECRVCGLTSEMAPKMAFRYCSKCAGQCCYCPEHIKDHECVVEPRSD